MLRKSVLVSAFALLFPTAITLACYTGDDEETNQNSISYYPYICPTNDTRHNLQMLIEDFYPQRASVTKSDFSYTEGRFGSNHAGTKDFIAAVKGAAGLNDAERSKLMQARMTMSSTTPLKVPAEVSEISSAVGKQYTRRAIDFGFWSSSFPLWEF